MNQFHLKKQITRRQMLTIALAGSVAIATTAAAARLVDPTRELSNGRLPRVDAQKNNLQTHFILSF